LVVELLLPDPSPANPHGWPPTLQHLPHHPYWVLGSPQPPQPWKIIQASDPCCWFCSFWLFSHPLLSQFCQKITK
jgi:hypothetical protein